MDYAIVSKADCGCADLDGFTALGQAAKFGHRKVVKKLSEAGSPGSHAAEVSDLSASRLRVPVTGT